MPWHVNFSGYNIHCMDIGGSKAKTWNEKGFGVGLFGARYQTDIKTTCHVDMSHTMFPLHLQTYHQTYTSQTAECRYFLANYWSFYGAHIDGILTAGFIYTKAYIEGNGIYKYGQHFNQVLWKMVCVTLWSRILREHLLNGSQLWLFYRRTKKKWAQGNLSVLLFNQILMNLGRRDRDFLWNRGGVGNCTRRAKWFVYIYRRSFRDMNQLVLMNHACLP